MVCHTRAANFVLGPSLVQMNRDFDYGHGVKRNQLETLERLRVLRLDYMGYVHEAIGHHWPGSERHAEQTRVEPARAASPAPKTDDANAVRPSRPAADDASTAGPALAKLPQREAKPTPLLPLDPDHLPRLVDPYDEHADINLRARPYLDANCAICHVLSGGGNALMDLGYNVPADRMQAIDERPQHESFGLAKAQLISPGQPSASVLLLRMARRGRGQMPPLATSRVDERAVALIENWIRRRKPTAPAAKRSPP